VKKVTNQKNKILGIITARGGSKRIPRKNIKDFLGQPLLAWTIEVGKKADVFDKFILTTDDREIAEIGRQYGVEVPFLRPKKFAKDTSLSYDAIRHAVDWLYNTHKYIADWIIMLEPSSPGRQAFHLQEVVKLIKTKNHFDSLLGISETPVHVSFLKQQQVDNKGIMTRAHDGAPMKSIILRSQEVPKSYFINSSIYAFRTSNLFDGDDSLWGARTYGYIMDPKYSLDIDTLEDWSKAEEKMKKILEEK
jgi:CMP-N,N'-diacetyllegionaminic acid synthase